MGMIMIVTDGQNGSVDIVIEFRDPQAFMGAMDMHRSVWCDDADDMVRIARSSGIEVRDQRDQG